MRPPARYLLSHRMMRHALAALLVLLCLSSTLLPERGYAQTWPRGGFCQDEREPRFDTGFEVLAEKLGVAMGQPLECPHVTEHHDIIQATSTGLAYWRSETNTASFTDGVTHWALTDAGVVEWLTSESDPPETATVLTPWDRQWATLLRVLGPDRLRVQLPDERQVEVQYRGVRAPENPPWRALGLRLQRTLLQGASQVWLGDGLDVENDADELLVRHVFIDPLAVEPLSVALLQEGLVHVYPDIPNISETTDATSQSQAVDANRGIWSEGTVGVLFVPRNAPSGIPVDPRVLGALNAVDADVEGHALLVQIGRFPVPINMTTLPSGVLGSFDANAYTTQLSERLLQESPGAAGAILMHELTHVKQLITGATDATFDGCLSAETEAFSVTARYWERQVGSRGKLDAPSDVEKSLNDTLARRRAGTLSAAVRHVYGHLCTGV